MRSTLVKRLYFSPFPNNKNFLFSKHFPFWLIIVKYNHHIVTIILNASDFDCPLESLNRYESSVHCLEKNLFRFHFIPSRSISIRTPARKCKSPLVKLIYLRRFSLILFTWRNCISHERNVEKNRWFEISFSNFFSEKTFYMLIGTRPSEK